MRRVVRLFACVALVGLLLPSAAFSQAPRPALGFWPGFSFLPVGRAADIQVRAMSFPSLYGCEIEIRYDPTALAVEDADPNADGIQVGVGDVFVGDEGFVGLNRVDPVAGVIRFAATLVRPAPAIHGSATLMRVRFTALRPGPTMLRFGSAILVDVDAQTIDARLADGGMWLGPIR